MTTDLVPADTRKPAVIIKEAEERATAVAHIIQKQNLISHIQGKNYVRVEGWVTLAAQYGLVTGIDWSRPLDGGGFEAKGELRRMDTGQLVSTAEAECGTEGDGPWPKRAAYAQRSMAETRAVSKVCRVALSWVMVLAGYETTPAEEVPPEGFGDRRQGKSTPPKGTAPTESQSEAKSRYDLKEALRQAYGNDMDEGALAFVRERMPEAVTDTQILWEGIPGEVCTEMIGELSGQQATVPAKGGGPQELAGS